MLAIVAFKASDVEAARGFAVNFGSTRVIAAFEGEVPTVGAGEIVRLAGAEQSSADTLAPAIVAAAEGCTTIASVSSMKSKDVMGRVAGELDCPMVSDAIAIRSESEYERPINAGALIETVVVSGTPVVVTFRSANFPATGDSAENGAERSVSVAASTVEVTDRQRRESARPDLSRARVVVSGGKPLKDAATFEKVVGGLADSLGGAVGATRAAVDSGIAANELQVGQTGKIVAPELYIAAGISGSTQHMAGIKDSKIIVAINKDAEAPIFDIADYGLVGDLFEIVPELQAKIEARGNAGG